MLLQRLEMTHLEQFHRAEPHFFAGATKLLQRHFVITPLANGMIDPAFEGGPGRLVRRRQPVVQRSRHAGDDGHTAKTSARSATSERSAHTRKFGWWFTIIRCHLACSERRGPKCN